MKARDALRVLVIDDDEEDAMIIADLLREDAQHPFETTWCGDAGLQRPMILLTGQGDAEAATRASPTSSSYPFTR